MKRHIKSVCIVLSAVIVCFCAYVTIDCVRLKKTSAVTAPIITVNKETADNRIIYNGVGYTISYYVSSPDETADTTDSTDIFGAEFRLFDRLLIWAWIE